MLQWARRRWNNPHRHWSFTPDENGQNTDIKNQVFSTFLSIFENKSNQTFWYQVALLKRKIPAHMWHWKGKKEKKKLFFRGQKLCERAQRGSILFFFFFSHFVIWSLQLPTFVVLMIALFSPSSFSCALSFPPMETGKVKKALYGPAAYRE